MVERAQVFCRGTVVLVTVYGMDCWVVVDGKFVVLKVTVSVDADKSDAVDPERHRAHAAAQKPRLRVRDPGLDAKRHCSSRYDRW